MKDRNKTYKCYAKVTPIVYQDHCYGFEVKTTEVNSIWSREDGKSVVSKRFFIDEIKAKNYADMVRA
tara:strand:+ start:743 stop:943 length:201 start_codon:yes stop_codon:yes gene_type:complete